MGQAEKREKPRVCFLVNPFAGAGGPLGWKGTDWPLPLRLADRDPWSLPAQARALRFLSEASRLGILPGKAVLLACPGFLGEEQARRAGVEYELGTGGWRPGWPTRPEDSVSCLGECLSRGDPSVIVFVGGDGTARLVASVVGERVPAVGVPAGVKVYSSVFSETPEAAARLLLLYLEGRARPVPRLVLDIDEEAFRSGKLLVRPYAHLLVPIAGNLVVSGKNASHPQSELEEMEEIAEYFRDEIAGECTLLILGPGYTVYKIAEALGVRGKTLLGVDAVHNGRIVGRDLDEERLLEILEKHDYKRAIIVVSPIGGQGYILGRGNQQISPRVIRRVGLESIIVVATPTKLRETPVLRVDTGDPELDEKLRGYIRVLTGYARYKLVQVR